MCAEKVLAHEKAVPAMIGSSENKPHPWRNGKWPVQKARPPAPADQVVDRIDAGSFETAVLSRCETPRTQEVPASGFVPCSTFLLLTTYCCGEARPRSSRRLAVFTSLLSQAKTSRGMLFGIEKALAKLPMPILRAPATCIAAGSKDFANSWKLGNFIPFGCDGTRQTCPCTDALERRPGRGRQKGTVADDLEHLDRPFDLGVPFCSALGQREQSQRARATSSRHAVSDCPSGALTVADAGYVADEVAAKIFRQRCSS